MKIVTVSTDTSAELAKGRSKHGVQAVMLSDRELEVTTRYGLRNETNVTPKGLAAMPIPTTILVDAEGTVRWIDQAEDYQIRSRPDQVLGAIREALD